MKYLKYFYWLIGISILILIVQKVELNEVIFYVVKISWWGLLIILMLYFFNFMADVLNWQLTLHPLPFNTTWLSRLFLVRLIGQVFNEMTPFATLGGEPLKAALLKQHYEIGYRTSIKSLFLFKTTDAISLIIFLAVGFVLLLNYNILSDYYKLVAGVGLSFLSAGVLIFYAIQRFNISSKIINKLIHFQINKKLLKFISHIYDIDKLLVEFYLHHRKQFAGALIFGFLNWVLGVLEIYYIMIFLDMKITFVEAWIIESIVQLVRAGTFFIPANIGVMEGSFMLIITAITGSPSLGIAVSVLRRTRQIIWTVFSLIIGWLYFSKTRLVYADDLES